MQMHLIAVQMSIVIVLQLPQMKIIKQGSFWNETPLDLSESFEIIVKPTFGCITESADGGDGIAFLLQANGIGQLPTGDGGNLGYNGISPSLVVQFDTYRDNPIIYPDNNDPGGGFFPYYDHVGLDEEWLL